MGARPELVERVSKHPSPHSCGIPTHCILPLALAAAARRLPVLAAPLHNLGGSAVCPAEQGARRQPLQTAGGQAGALPPRPPGLRAQGN